MPTIRKRFRTRNGKRTEHWQCFCRLPGKNGRVFASKVFPAGTDKADVRQWGLEEERRQSTGDVPTLKRREWKQITLRSLYQDYTKYYNKWTFSRKKSYDNENIHIEAFFNRMPHIANDPWPSLLHHTDEIQRYVDEQINAGNKSSALKRDVIYPLRSIINRFAKKRRRPPLDLPDPFRNIDLPPNPQSRDWVLSDDELLRLYVAIIEGCRGRQQKLLWLTLVRLAICTGLRRIQLLNLQWKDVDFDKRKLWANPAKKETKGRWVPLSNATCSFLRSYFETVPQESREDRSRIFPITDTAHAQGWKRIIINAKLFKSKDDPSVMGRAPVNAKAYYFTFHGLRHRFATYHRSKKILTADEVSYMLGHIDKRMSARYEHIWDQLVEDIRVSLDAAEEKDMEALSETSVGPLGEIAMLRLFANPDDPLTYSEDELWKKARKECALWQWGE